MKKPVENGAGSSAESLVFSEFDLAHEMILGKTEIGEAIRLVEYAISVAARTPGDSKFANATAALASFVRAVRDLKAALVLCQYHHYGQAMALMRSVQEAAGIGRTMAHSGKVAEKWINGEWQSDAKARQFVANVMLRDEPSETKEEAVSAFEETYDFLSSWAHVTVSSALIPYLKDLGERGYGFELDPSFDQTLLADVLEWISKQALHLVYAVRNSAADAAVFGPEWNSRLDDLGTRVAGDFAQPARRDRQEFEESYERILRNLRPNSELKKRLKRDPNSVQNLLSDT